jgi:hypothetical protein
MVKKIEWKPEKLDDNTYRVKVMGGWMVTTIVNSTKGVGIGVNCIFISDQHWEWYILEQIVDPKVVRNNIAKDFEPVSK